MTVNKQNLLAVFDERMHDLIKLCDTRKSRIVALETSLSETEEQLRQAKQTIESLQTKYENLLTARALAADKSELQNARRRVDKLVREVDTCIALLKD